MITVMALSLILPDFDVEQGQLPSCFLRPSATHMWIWLLGDSRVVAMI